MKSLRYPLLTFTLLGCLPPASWTSTVKRTFYKVYSVLMLMFVQSVMWMSILDIVFNVSNLNEFYENFYITSAIVISTYKRINFLRKRTDIMFLIDKMETEPFMPKNEAEWSIKRKSDKEVRIMCKVYLMVINSYVLVCWGSSLARDLKTRKLGNPRVWVPYDYSSATLYTVTYCHQAVTMLALTFMHYANDTLISSLMILIHGQLALLEHRLQNIMGDRNQSVKACARHHEYIYRMAADVNNHFNGILGFQFFVSSSMACLTLFRITSMTIGLQFYEAVMYICCTLMQLSCYCWYGNEVKLKSLGVPDTIFASNWPDLDEDLKKMLTIIMLRATSPVEFSSAHIIPVDLHTFMSVLKTSYSVFSVLNTK